jgi:protein-S-isoprenylcysteine O-methyltransferase Ste14
MRRGQRRAQPEQDECKAWNRTAAKRMTALVKWSGGAIFVISLVVCLCCYLFVLGESSPWMGWAPFGFDAFLLTVFAAHHSVFARTGVKQRLASAIPEPLLRSVYVWIASLLLIGVCVLWQRVGGELYASSGWFALLHAAIQLGGILVIAQSVRAIDPLELAGIRPPSGRDGLQVSGPYRLVRHPLYFGWALACFGAAHMTGDRLTFAALTSLYLAIAIPWEERSLVDSFGDAYRRYQRQVRWKMIPFIY